MSKGDMVLAKPVKWAERERTSAEFDKSAPPIALKYHAAKIKALRNTVSGVFREKAGQANPDVLRRNCRSLSFAAADCFAH